MCEAKDRKAEPAPVAETPLPRQAMIVVASILVSEASCYQFVFPFVPFMVRDFGVEEANVGYYAGAIAAAYMLGQFFSSFFWGWASDRIGLRPVILFGLCATIVCVIAMGFSTSISWAIGTRFLAGILNGNIGVCKTFVYLITDESNEARAYGFYPLCWGIGSILGPTLGGLLAKPVVTYPGIFSEGSVFDTFPYLLPALAVVVIPLVGLVVGLNYLEEPARDRGRGQKQTEKSLQHQRLDDEVEMMEAAVVPHEGRDTLADGDKPTLKKTKSFRENVFSKRVMIAIALYCNIRFTVICADDAVPLLFSTSKAEKGLELDAADIGTILMVQGMFLMFISLMVIPPLKNRYGAVPLFWGAQVLIPFALVGMSFLSEVRYMFSGTSLFFVIQCVLFLKAFGYAISFTTVAILLNCSTPPECLGTVNGLAQTICAGASAAAPALGGIMFAWSLSSGMSFPFDIHFCFVVCAVVAVFNLIVASFLDSNAASRP